MQIKVISSILLLSANIYIMRYIFFDTNVIQHPVDFPDILDLHKENIKFYNDSKLCVLSQVYNELHSHGMGIKEWLWTILEYDYVLEDESPDHMIDCYIDLYKYAEQCIEYYKRLCGKGLVDVEKKSRQIISDIYFGLEKGFWSDYDYLTSIITSDNWFAEWVLNKITGRNHFTGMTLAVLNQKIQSLAINYDQEKTTTDPSVAIVNIIEKTPFWDKEYRYWYTHKDIFRLTWNFTHDYKWYKRKKSVVQQQKIGKDSMVLADMIFSLPLLSLSLERDDIIFISSDYPFIKELIQFFKDVNTWDLFLTENYKDLSSNCIKTAKAVTNKVKIIKLDVAKLYFENVKWVNSRQLLDVVL